MTDRIAAPIEQTQTQTQTPPTHNGDDTHTQTHRMNLPRIKITYCTQCKWMLRAAYFGQELLSTFNTTLGEVALVPATGGVFTVTILDNDLKESLLWDRKRDGGFPEVKQLKALVRNIVDPTRNLGHVDRALEKASNKEKNEPSITSTTTVTVNAEDNNKNNTTESRGQPISTSQVECEDCR